MIFNHPPPKSLRNPQTILKKKNPPQKFLKQTLRKREVKDTPTIPIETTQETKEPIQSLTEDTLEKKEPLTDIKPKEEDLKNTKTVERIPSHNAQQDKKEEKVLQETIVLEESNEQENEESTNIQNETSQENKILVQDRTETVEKKEEPPKKQIHIYTNQEDEENFPSIENQKYLLELQEFSENEDYDESTYLLQEGNVQDKSVELSKLSQKVLEDLEINPNSLNVSQAKALNKIVNVEKRFWNGLMWSNLSILLHKIFFAVTTNQSAVNNEKRKICNPLWPYGGPVSLKNSAAIQRNAVFKTLGSSIEEGVTDSLETIFVSLMGLLRTIKSEKT